MSEQIKEKKSETIEVRMGYSQKRSFMEACKRNGKNASHVIRDYVDAYVAPKAGPNGVGIFKKWVVMPLGVLTIIAIVAGFSLISVTYSPETNAALFKSLDTDEDNVISQADITEENVTSVTQFLQWVDENNDGQVTFQEFDSVKTFNASKLGIERDGADGKAPSIFSVELEVGPDGQ